MRAALASIAADLAEASDLLVLRIATTLNAPIAEPGDDIAREASLYAASVLIGSVRRPDSVVGDHEGIELLVHWLAAFLPHYKNEPEVFFKAAEQRAAQYIVLWEHDADAAALNAARFFSEMVDRPVTEGRSAELAELLNTGRYASDAFIQAAFAHL